MQIVKPYAKILYPETHSKADGIALLQRVENIARVSHRSEDAQTPASWERFLQNVVMDRGDWSVTEHCSVTVEFLVDRGITHEAVRHRIAAITQESTRFVNYEKKMAPSFVYPQPDVRCDLCLSGNEARLDVHTDRYRHWTDHVTECAYNQNWLRGIDNTETAYKSLLADGWPPECARSVFPNALSAKLIYTLNFRMWRHFFLMRSSKEAHRSMREVVSPLLREFQEFIPLLFADIQPESRQIDNMRKAR
jgi:thymidylate synthase (FAD)